MIKTSQRKTLLALVVGVVLVAVTLTACAPATPRAEPDDPAVQAPGEIQRITLEESKSAFENGEALFLDVRSQSSYAASHIPGAQSIPLVELRPRIEELDPSQWIITYCT